MAFRCVKGKIMDDDMKKPDEQDLQPDPCQLNAIEKFYEKFRGIPLKYIDLFIVVCVAALILVILMGMLKERGIL